MAQATKFEKMQSEMMVALKKAFAADNIDALAATNLSFEATDADKKICLDHVFREYLLALLEDNSKDISDYERYVNLCITACRRSMCSELMPVLLLSDLFDGLTLDKCELLFAFVENGVHTWKESCFFNACKNNILRMCNDLLRRLSRSQNTVFCGRILLFLAKFFPFSERSGLNIVSEFNMENTTEYGADVDKEGLEQELKGDKMDDDSEKTDQRLKIDYNLYHKFWALQDFFRNPNQCYNKLQWRIFIMHAGSVLSAFSSFKLEDVPRSSKRSSARKSTDDMDSSETVQQYFAKFLTNQKLLELQLSDSNFRRYVLVQFLILFQYLPAIVKFRSEADALKPEQVEWVNDTTKQVYGLLAETPPDGEEFAQSVRHILSREEHWSAWKNEACCDFKKPLVKSETEEPPPPARPRPAKRLGDYMKAAYAQKKYVMGNPELTKLWNLSANNIEACRSKDRDFLPSLEAYFEEAIQQADPSNQIEASYKRVNDSNFGWRALRLLARRSPHFFTHSNNPIHILPEYLEMMIKRIAKDLPATSGPEETAKQADVMEDLQPTTQEEDELLRDEKEEESKVQQRPAPEVVEEEDSSRTKSEPLTANMLNAVAEKLGAEWAKLASKLGYAEDEIEYFRTEHPTELARASHVLKLWSQDDEDASVPSLEYILSGLGMTEASAALRSTAS